MGSRQANDITTSFQPFPKRFMIWDTSSKDWLEDNYGNRTFGFVNMFNKLGSRFYLFSEWVILQSSGLISKNSTEICEGHIVDFTYFEVGTQPWEMIKRRIRGVVGCDSLGWYVGKLNDYKIYFRYHYCSDSAEEFGKRFTTVGHIMTNPELLEDEK